MDPSALFLGPQGQNAREHERLLVEVLRDHVHWRRGLHPEDPDAVDPMRQLGPAFMRTGAVLEASLRRLLGRLKSSVPFHSPRYLGHMTGDTLLPAQVGYVAAMLYNPNNVAHEGSPVTSELEAEVVRDLLRLMGLPTDTGGGHLCGGGTVANVEALWMMRNLQGAPLLLEELPRDRWPAIVDVRGVAIDWSREDPADVVGRLGPDTLRLIIEAAGRTPDRSPPFALLVPATRHYSWDKAVNLVGLPRSSLVRVPVDSDLRLDPAALAQVLDELHTEGRPVLACVGVLGTTEAGGVDPIDAIVELRRRWSEKTGRHFFVHVDAAYGGYARALFMGADGSLRTPAELESEGLPVRPGLVRAMAATGAADSITIDPHKLGFVPYPAGAFVMRDRRWRLATSFHAAYVNEGHDDHPGSSSLEGSRPGAAAAACWLAHRTVPLDSRGYGVILRDSFRSSRGLAELLEGRQLAGHRCVVLQPPDLDVLLYAFAPVGQATLARVNEVQLRILSQLGPEGRGPFALASTRLDHEVHADSVRPLLERLGVDPAEWRPGASLTLLRSVMMTPFVTEPEVKTFYRAHLIEALADALRG